MKGDIHVWEMPPREVLRRLRACSPWEDHDRGSDATCVAPETYLSAIILYLGPPGPGDPPSRRWCLLFGFAFAFS